MELSIMVRSGEGGDGAEGLPASPLSLPSGGGLRDGERPRCPRRSPPPCPPR